MSFLSSFYRGRGARQSAPEGTSAVEESRSCSGRRGGGGVGGIGRGRGRGGGGGSGRGGGGGKGGGGRAYLLL